MAAFLTRIQRDLTERLHFHDADVGPWGLVRDLGSRQLRHVRYTRHVVSRHGTPAVVQVRIVGAFHPDLRLYHNILMLCVLVYDRERPESHTQHSTIIANARQWRAFRRLVLREALVAAFNLAYEDAPALSETDTEPDGQP